ncbi:MAG: hypothetical protein F6K42_04780 [Leptolyngbya sp. SIO1D8]|nr:hypothetical protein [Leptolyngbya sp. SIO1D8]
MTDIHNMEEPRRFLDWLNSQGFKVIYLRRKERFKHAVSLVTSAKVGKLHHRKKEGHLKREPVEINPTEVLETISKFESCYQEEINLLQGIPHLPLIYEENLANGEEHQKTADLVFDYLQLEPEKVKAKLVKIMPQDLAETILNYEEVVGAVKQSKYAHILA